MLFFGEAENSILELEHVTVFAAVAFGEHGDVVVLIKTFLEALAKACIHAWILMDRNAAGTVQNPAEHRSLPETSLCHESCRCNRMPNDIDIQKTLVVSDDDIAIFFWDVFGTFYRNLDAEQLENDIPERKCANFGAIFPMTADTTVKGVRDTRNEHNAKDDDVVKKC